MNFMQLKEAVNSLPVAYVFATATTDGVTPAEEVAAKGLGIQVTKNGHEIDPESLLDRKGNFTCICPFHNDNSEGSLVLTSNVGQKNLWKCFSCGAGLSPIDFEMQFYNLDFKEAVKHLAFRMGLDQEGSAASTTSREIKRNTYVEMKLADDDVIDYTYRAMNHYFNAFAKGNGVPDIVKHLTEVRHLSEEDGKEYMVFQDDRDSYTTTHKCVLRYFVYDAYAKSQGMSLPLEKRPADEEVEIFKSHPFYKKLEEQMRFVPGFYFDEKKGETLTDVRGGTLGLVCYDDLGRARGIQTQNLSGYGAKYKWFSSYSKLGQKGIEGGSSVGAQAGVVYPKESNNKNNYVVITEGKYKAEAIAKEGLTAVYLTGVNSWKPALPIIERLTAGQSKVYLAFDADTMGNNAVNDQLIALAEELKKSFNLETSVLVWSKKFGKGFDDLRNYLEFECEEKLSIKEFMKAISFSSYKQIREFCVHGLNKKMIKDPSTLNAEEKRVVAKVLQDLVEKQLGLKQK